MKSSFARALAQTLARPLTGYPGGTIYLSEAQWEALEEYDWNQTYVVDGIGTYRGPTLLGSAAWEPAAGDYYVAKTGSDSNAGTDPGAPKLTIASAFGAISTGNSQPITIWVDEGTYAESISATGYFYIAAKSFAHPVTIRAVPGADVTLTGVSGNYVVFFFGACANVQFRELTVASTASCLSVAQIQSTGRASACKFLDCTFSDANNKATSITANGTGGTTDLQIKRCTWTSSNTFGVTIGNADGVRFIGNDLRGTNAGSVTCTAGTMSATGTYRLNSNKSVGAITLTGSTGSKLRVHCYDNAVRNISHTGGNVTYPSLLQMDRNIVASTTQAGIDIRGFTLDGSCNDNSITTTANTVALAWPHEGIAHNCEGAEIRRNTITNNVSVGHGLLIGVGGTEQTVSDNLIYCDAGGSYGIVLKGDACGVTGNDVYGGSSFPLLLKGARNCVLSSNTIRSTVAGVVCAIRISTEDIDSTTPAAGNEISDNTFVVTEGPLWNQADDGSIGEDQLFDDNIYQISGNGTWGSLLGNPLASLADLRAAWASDYPDNPLNDANSLAA